MLHARLDESYTDSPRTTQIYVVAGFVGSCRQWWEFDRRWRKSMKALGVENVGSHASKCAVGAKPYHEFTPQQRHQIQHRLIEDIADSCIYGCVAVSAMDGWRQRRDIFSRLLGKDQKKFNEPHILAMRQCVQFMHQVTERATQEPIAFVVDQNTDTGGRAREWYDLMLSSPKSPPEFRARLGPYSEGDRSTTLGLQAADMLAYAAFRNFSGKSSWQWQELLAARRLSALLFDEIYWERLERDVRAAVDADVAAV